MTITTSSVSSPPVPAPPEVADDAATVLEICRRVADRPGDTRALVAEEVHRLAPVPTSREQELLTDSALARLGGLGELDVHLRDPEVDEVMVNAGRSIWIERHGALHHVGTLEFDSLDHLIERVLAPLGRRVDRSSPIVDARLPSGARVCVVLPPVAVDGPSLSIRRFAPRVRPLDSFVDAGGAELLRAVIDLRCNVVVSGATSSGKTSLVAALLATVPDTERLIVVEDTAELPIEHRHVVRLEARPPLVDGPPPITVADLVRTSLRLRPDRIVVGEARGDEVLALVQAMNTGHDGSLSTCHANGPLDALLRLETLVLQASPTWPLAAIRHQLGRCIDVVIHVDRHPGRAGRHVSAVCEVVAPDADSTVPLTLRTLGGRQADGSFAVVGRPSRGRT
jgi:pilus assembly protein CpaF